MLPRDLKLARQLYMSGEKDIRKQEIFGQKKPGSVGYNYKITNWGAPPIPLHKGRIDNSGKKL